MSLNKLSMRLASYYRGRAINLFIPENNLFLAAIHCEWENDRLPYILYGKSSWTKEMIGKTITIHAFLFKENETHYLKNWSLMEDSRKNRGLNKETVETKKRTPNIMVNTTYEY